MSQYSMIRRYDEKRFDAFVKGLTALSRRYGICINVVGGVFQIDDPSDIADLEYDTRNNGDLMPVSKFFDD